MDKMMEKAFAMIEAQQPKIRNKVWMIGEQLKDIIRMQPRCAKLVAKDLEIKKMSLGECEKKMDAFAKANHGCVIPVESDRIIREFYGLPPIDEDQRPEEERDNLVDMTQYF